MNKRTIADFRWVGRYTDFLVNEIGEDGRVVHLTSLEYGGRGKQQTGTGNGQEKVTGTEIETGKQENKQSEQEKTPAAPATVKVFEVLRVLSDVPNMWRY